MAPVWPDRPAWVWVRGGPIRINLRESAMMRRRATGCYEPATRALLLSLLAPGMHAVEVGANRGYFSVLMAAAVGPGGRLDVFEPEPDNLAALAKSLRPARTPQAHVHPVAVADRAGTAVFHRGTNSGWGSLHDDRPGDSGAMVEVRTERLDTVLAGARIDVVKIDVEGADAEVVAGMTGLLADGAVAHIVVDIDRRLSADEITQIQAALASHGYSWCCIDAHGRRHDDWRPGELLWARPAGQQA